MTNPYAHDRSESEFAAPVYAVPDNNAYAVPSGGAPYTTAPGWSPALRAGSDSFPDTSRLGTGTRRTIVPDDGTQPEQFYRPLDADKRSRSSVEYQDADGWEETKDYPGYPAASSGANRFAPNPRATPPAEPRPTSRMAPRTYLFTRPFMTNTAKVGARSLSGIHFSMADHRRTYDVLGMAPVATRRNTYRINPQPWDSGLVDMPPQNATNVTDIVETPMTVEVSYQSRNWRLS